MTRILITSGPTRQYLDPVRFLSNASSGRMGQALAAAAMEAGYDVVIVTGPVQLDYPPGAHVVPVISTEEMLTACRQHFPHCGGLIAAAAPCDYRPRVVQADKIRKTGQPLTLLLEETPDVVATLSRQRRADQWVVCFALESSDARARAARKLHQKQCDLIVVNGPQAIDSVTSQVELLGQGGALLDRLSGSKRDVARGILRAVQRHLRHRP